MNGYKKFTTLVLGILILGVFAFTSMAAEPQNLSRAPLRVNGTGYLNKYLVTYGALTSATSWPSIDSGVVDTSEAYPIVPGCYVNYSLKTDAAADTILQVRVYGAQTASPANWIIVDSLFNITSVVKSRNIGGTAAAAPILSLGQPVMFRFLWFVVQADGDAAADTVNVTGWVVSSPSLND